MNYAELTIKEIGRDHYFPEKERRNRRANTLYGYRSSTELHVFPEFGDLTIVEITRDHVQDWVDSDHFAGNPGGCEKAYKCLRQIIRWAIDKWGLYVADPTRGIELPRKPKHKIETLTARRLKRLVRGMVGCEHEPTFVLSAALGLRPGESYALEWGDINWRTGLVPIRHTLQQVKNLLFLYPTKTAKSERDLFLPQWALDRLHQIWVERGRPKGRIIGDAKPSKVARRIKRWIEAMRLPKITMQRLRHTWGTIAATAGNPIETVASMMGHSNIQTCYRYYFQLTPAAIKRAQRKVARSIMGKTCDDMYKGLQLAPVPEGLRMAA